MKSIFTCLLFIIANISFANIELICPPDVTLPCGSDISNLDIYGNATIIIDGVSQPAQFPETQYFLNTCNVGSILRTWSAKDGQGNLSTCTQRIGILPGPFNESNIRWPESDTILQSCAADLSLFDLPYEFLRPEVDYVSCSHIGISSTDRKFNFGPDCRKLIRTWTVLDWCSYNPSTGQGRFTFSQEFKFISDSEAILSCAKDIVVHSKECDGARVDVPLSTVEGMPCTGEYTIINNSVFADTTSNDASGFYPIGNTTFEYIVEAACGRNTTCQTTVNVLSPKPVPYCLATAKIALSPIDIDGDGIADDGLAEIWAEDLDINSFHPCNNRPLSFSFGPDVDSTFIHLDCSNVGSNLVDVYVTDFRGDQSFCKVDINVQNNAANIPNCSGSGNQPLISGQVVNSENVPMQGVLLTLKDRRTIEYYQERLDSQLIYAVVDSFYDAAGQVNYIYDYIVLDSRIIIDTTYQYNVAHLVSDEMGQFSADDLLENRDYQVTAYSPNFTNSVATTDLNLLLAYISGTYQFINPYSYLAADINEDGYINEIDYGLLYDLYYDIEDEWPQERRWIFFDPTTVSTQLPMHEARPAEYLELQNLQQGQANNLELMAVLKGSLSTYENLINNQALDKRQTQTGIAITPNPFVEEINLPQNVSEIIIQDNTGQMIYTGHQKKINTATWASGIYYYQLLTDDGAQSSGRLVKVK